MVNFLIVCSGFNCRKYIEGCIESIKNQTYQNYFAVIVDDGSQDGTAEYLLSMPSNNRIGRLWQTQNSGIVACREYATNYATNAKIPFDVIVWLDLDDELQPNALEILNMAYSKKNTWLTYGGYVDSYGNSYMGAMYPIYPTVPARKQEWKFIPLRSFRRELWNKITKEDKFPEVREVYPDAHVLYCLLEMAGEHAKPIDYILYKYNCSNPLNVTKRFPVEQRDAELNFIKSLEPKLKLDRL